MVKFAKNFLNPRFDQSGASLIEVMVASAITLIVLLALTSMVVTQQREVTAITQKLLLKEIETQLRNVFLNDAFCGCVFRGRTFDLTQPSVPIDSLPLAFKQPLPAPPTACTTTGGDIVPPAGSKIGSTLVKVQSLEIANILDQGAGNFTGEIVITLDPKTLIRAIKPALVPISFSVLKSDPLTAAHFIACGSPGLYSTTCTFGSANYNTFACCQMNLQDGTVDCKDQPASYPIDQHWISAGSPFTLPKPGGQYELSCTGGVNNYNTMTCCRSDRKTGSTECSQRDVWPSTVWKPIPTPENPF